MWLLYALAAVGGASLCCCAALLLLAWLSSRPVGSAEETDEVGAPGGADGPGRGAPRWQRHVSDARRLRRLNTIREQGR